ncbi:MAG: PTS sugar transporter subunit IIA [Maledivibacter sp.]|jgi:mannitol/fructose-specific phosphotransferase system IIA component (Ntr-type)|nr:PTS sugar transporter subunit IIA [Maledivibacter sp.]
MLKDLITYENIEVDVEAVDWEDAVYRGAKILLDKEYITPKYIDEITNKVKEIGPYIVIAPGIALSHARPEDGVKKLSMSIMTLKNPIEFGNEDNDPVKLLITLGAVDNETHLKALYELMKLLNNSEDVKKIFKAKDKQEILKVLSKYSK